MDSNDAGVLIPITFSDAEARTQLEEFRKNTTDSANEIGDALRNKAGGGFDVLKDKLHEFGMHQRAEHREARIFASTLAQVLPDGAKAAGAALGAFAIGGPLALGFEALKFTIEHVAEAMRAGSEIAAKLAKSHAEAAADATKAWDAFDKKRREANELESTRIHKENVERNKKEMQDELNQQAALLIEKKRIEKENDYGYDYEGKKQKLKLIEDELQESKQRQLGIAIRAGQENVRAESHTTAEIHADRVKHYGESLRKANEYFAADLKLAIQHAQEVQKAHDQHAKEALKQRLDEERELTTAIEKAAEIRAVIADVEANHVSQAVARRRVDVSKAAIGELNEITVLEQRGVISHDEAERIKTSITRAAATERTKILEEEINKQSHAMEKFKEFAKQVYADLSNKIVGEYGKMIDSCKAYDDAQARIGGTAKASADEQRAAMAKMVQDVLSSIAQQAAAKALFELGTGFALLAEGGGIPSPASDSAFTSAAIFGGIAGVAGVGAYAIGQQRGLTQSENQSLRNSSATASGTGAGSGARGAGGGGTNAPTERTSIIVLSNFGETLDQAAARAVPVLRRLKQMDYRP